MLGLIARHAQRQHPSLGHVVASAAYAVFGIVAARGKRLYLDGIERHNLSHPHVTQWNAHRAKQVVRVYLVGIPVGNRVGGTGEFIGFTVGKTSRFVTPLNLQLALGTDSVYCLIVNHAPVILEKRSVFARDIDEHRRESVRARTAVAPQCRLGASGIAMAASARISGIDRAKAASVVVAARAHVVVEPVASREAARQCSGHPLGLAVVGF